MGNRQIEIQGEWRVGEVFTERNSGLIGKIKSGWPNSVLIILEYHLA